MSEYNALYKQIESTMVARFREAETVAHLGDRGENREQILRDFLSAHLPKVYGVTKGEVITPGGGHSHSADVIIYDAARCPVLYAERTAILPIEGVYGIIEVKSRLSKAELEESLQKISKFRSRYKAEPVEVRNGIVRQTFMPSPPFGFVFAFDVAGNSLESLYQNVQDHTQGHKTVDYLAGLVTVLGHGVVHYALLHPDNNAMQPVLESKHLFNVLVRNEIVKDGVEWRRQLVAVRTGSQTFGRFFTYLLMTLERSDLGVVNLANYAQSLMNEEPME
ncbi:MAG: DUF6602 domain-containing protein [Thermomicrobiales bacterium]